LSLKTSSSISEFRVWRRFHGSWSVCASYAALSARQHLRCRASTTRHGLKHDVYTFDSNHPLACPSQSIWLCSHESILPNRSHLPRYQHAPCASTPEHFLSILRWCFSLPATSTVTSNILQGTFTRLHHGPLPIGFGLA
jgi:hypothetical protein